jgi:hypothetical protein
MSHVADYPLARRIRCTPLCQNSPLNAILLQVNVLVVEFVTLLWNRSLWPIGGISPTYQYVLEMYAVGCIYVTAHQSVRNSKCK